MSTNAADEFEFIRKRMNEIRSQEGRCSIKRLGSRFTEYGGEIDIWFCESCNHRQEGDKPACQRK